jgi:hypothetical protein
MPGSKAMCGRPALSCHTQSFETLRRCYSVSGALPRWPGPARAGGRGAGRPGAGRGPGHARHAARRRRPRHAALAGARPARGSPRWHHAACVSHGRAPRTRGRTHATHPQRRRRSGGGSRGWTGYTASSGPDQVRSRRASTASPTSRSTACAGVEQRSAPWSTCRPDRVAQCQLSNPHLGYYPLSQWGAVSKTDMI